MSMDRTKNLIEEALQSCKNTQIEDFPTILNIWETAIAELKKNNASSVSSKIENKRSTTENSEPSHTVKRKKRGRPRKVVSLETSPRDCEHDKANVIEESGKNCLSPTGNKSTSRRHSSRTIIPSKRYPEHSLILLKNKISEESITLDKETEKSKEDTLPKETDSDSPVIKETEKSKVDEKLESVDHENNTKKELVLHASKCDNVKTTEKEHVDTNDHEDNETNDKSSLTKSSNDLKIVKTTRPRFNMWKNASSGKPQDRRCKCHTCGKILTNYSNLQVHMRSHNGEKPYSCGICCKLFSAKSNMRRHEHTHTGAKPFQCTECNKAFTEKKSLKVHMRLHTGEKPFQCHLCEQSFSQSGTLKAHLHIHNGVKSFLCDFCGKPFRQKTQMRVHMMRHANIRNYSCDVCSSSFTSKGDRDRHCLKHTGERPHKCNVCPKTFTRLQYLREHVKGHNVRKVKLEHHKCKSCDLSFQTLFSYLQHIKAHNSELPEGISITSGLPTSEVNDAENSSKAEESQETLIVVLDQSVIDGIYQESIINPEKKTQSQGVEEEQHILIEGHMIEEKVEHTEEKLDDNHVTLVSEEALRFLHESQLSQQQYQTLVVTEEQLSQIQQLNLQEGQVFTTNGNEMMVTTSDDLSNEITETEHVEVTLTSS